MYKRYNHNCSIPVNNMRSIPLCEPMPSPGPGAVPESTRIAVEPCTTAWVAATPKSVCDPQPTKTQVAVIPGMPYPIVDVVTVAASKTIQQQKQALENLTSDPYNPATRFSQYFPAPPIPYCPPTRVPNNDPKPSTQPCRTVVRFQGSSVSN
jgi:hypothetical protein